MTVTQRIPISEDPDRMLKLMHEMKSLLEGRSLSPFVLVRNEFNLQGSNMQVYNQYLDILVEKGLLIDSGHDRIIPGR